MAHELGFTPQGQVVAKIVARELRKREDEIATGTAKTSTPNGIAHDIMDALDRDDRQFRDRLESLRRDMRNGHAGPLFAGPGGQEALEYASRELGKILNRTVAQ